MREIFPKLDVGNNASLIHRVFNYSSHRSSRNKSMNSLWRWSILEYSDPGIPRKKPSYTKSLFRDAKRAWHLFVREVVNQTSRKIRTLLILTTGVITLKGNYYLGLENSFLCFSQFMYICISFIDLMVCRS